MRHKGWDYGGSAWYFITICVKDGSRIFGHVEEDQMVLNTLGRIVADEWQKTPIIRPYVALDEWVVMPNHFHGILAVDREAAEHSPRWCSGCLGAIVNQFKRACTKRIRPLGHNDFAWQRNFYDHIIRNEKDLERIREYILNNPLQWALKYEIPEYSHSLASSSDRAPSQGAPTHKKFPSIVAEKIPSPGSPEIS